MSQVSEQRWKMWMGNMPMPPDCNSEVMWAMYDVVKNMEDKEYAAEQIAWYESLWKVYLPQYRLAKERESLEPVKYENLCEIMKLIKENILLFRKWISE